MHDVDIAILGGGTAAAAAALTLAQSEHRTVVIAPAHEEGDRPGESLSASGVEVLTELQLAEAFATVPQRRSELTYSAWGAALLAQAHGFANAAGAPYVIDRSAFDRFLYDAFARSVSHLSARVASANPEGDGWQVTLDDDRCIRARFIIDCTGAAAIGARTVNALRRADRLVAAYAVLNQETTDVEPTRATMLEAVEHGWWYATLLPDGRISIALFSDPESLPRQLLHDVRLWKALVEETLFVRQWLESAEFRIDEPPRIAAAGTTWLESVAGENWAAAGDAAATFDPLSSHGLSSALWSGRRAALSATAALGGDPRPLRRYAERFRSAIESMLEQRARIYAQERRFAQSPFWQERPSLGKPADLPKT